MRRTVMRPILAAVAALMIMGTAAPAMAVGDTVNLVFNILLPGRGQAQRGLYTKAAVLGGVTIAGYIGLYASQINYNRSVEAFDDDKETWESYRLSLQNQVPVLASDIEQTGTSMQNNWNTADSRYNVRNAFIGVLAVTYTLNLIDLLMSERQTGELSDPDQEPSMMIGRTHDGFMVYRTINF